MVSTLPDFLFKAKKKKKKKSTLIRRHNDVWMKSESQKIVFKRSFTENGPIFQ